MVIMLTNDHLSYIIKIVGSNQLIACVENTGDKMNITLAVKRECKSPIIT